MLKMQRSSNDIKISLLQHSQAKVSLYGAYLSIYLNILSRSKHFTNILLFDLLCGEGLYEGDSKGSPLVALQRIQDHFDQNPESPLKINVIFNDNGFSEIEKGVKKIERLKSIIDRENTPANTIIEYYEKDFEQILSESVERVHSSFNPKALFFIDPYGYKNIKPRHVKKLLSLKTTEAILFLPASHMYRFANRCLKSPFCGSEPLYDFLIELFSNSVPSFNSATDFIERCKRQFKNYLSHEEVLVDSFSIERNRTNTYCLFFFTSKILGFEKMLEEKWKIDTDQGKGFKLTNQQMGLFDSVNISEYPKMLESYISENNNVTNKDIYYFGLNNGYLPKHSKQVLKRLEDSGRRVTESLDGKPVKGYYISYKNYRDPPERRIAFRIKKR